MPSTFARADLGAPNLSRCSTPVDSPATPTKPNQTKPNQTKTETATKTGNKGPRPRSRTLTHVKEAILEDVVYPTEILGKRTVYRRDGSKQIKVLLDPVEQVRAETKLDTFRELLERGKWKRGAREGREKEREKERERERERERGQRTHDPPNQTKPNQTEPQFPTPQNQQRRCTRS